MEENLFESLFIIINDKVTNINELNCFACFSHAPLIYHIHFNKSILFFEFFYIFLFTTLHGRKCKLLLYINGLGE